MNLGTPSSAIEMLTELKRLVKDISDVEVFIAPPFTAIATVVDFLKDTNLNIGAQNMYYEEYGAFTGEISPIFLKEMGVTHIIIGHSERRTLFNETDELINKKLKKALEVGLIPIVCIGENLQERKEGKTKTIIKKQFEFSFKGLSKTEMEKTIIAYEPIWAIGTGKTATPEQAEEIHLYIRDLIGDYYGDGIANNVRIQYGGSIKPDNARALFNKENIDGGLVGGASLNPQSFFKIIDAAKKSS